MTALLTPAAVGNPDLLPLLGRTPLARISTPLPHPRPGFRAKLKGLAAGGMKARSAVAMLRGAHTRGELRPGATVVESASGTLGIGPAFAGQALGHPVVLIGDTELEPSVRQLLRSCGARPELVGRPARPRLMRGLGSSIHPRNVARQAFDEVHWVGPAEAVDTCRRPVRGAFVSGGWSTGAVALVAAWAARLHSGVAVATVFPDGPHRCLGTVYGDAFCRRHGPEPERAVLRPIEIPHPAAAEVTGRARCRTARPGHTGPAEQRGRPEQAGRGGPPGPDGRRGRPEEER
ncbi:pyridoxal-phosphate dependent enzyme [Streptomyces sp. CB01881]|uniref:pyridoxal-phosphate dependent enzyme n=1 Tax=Streptomyces sp. CB01881 TaxID=2078691 RepID=UPI000CDBC1EC|nr:pyridoxal-phosphate dependent enzyme [Streptomyces sp. CB01881]AUY52469.1 hypothetical protein C2142_30135 [Streptomyces sp. CB01881]TYC71896.1 pyridoxal-phosphate dependent enzyme [Streptomyces sp. CB01881]